MAKLQIDQSLAKQIIDSLGKGVPPHRGVSAYATGTEFAEKVRSRHLEGGIANGKIRFVGGSWGAGKTHFFRLIREYAFEEKLLVSTVELSSHETPFNKFERVFFEIVRNITSPAMYEEANLSLALPFGEVLREALARWEGDYGSTGDAVRALTDELMQQTDIDIDFRRVVVAYWTTYATVGAEVAALENARGTLLQWFEGEGQLRTFQREYEVQKMVKRENARIVLASLGKFVRWLGFSGLLVLLDESEMSHSTMRKSSLKDAHNNLLHLINEIDDTEGLFLIYAAVPDFWEDPKSGIRTYGALAGRIGALDQKPPRALDNVWNIDHLTQDRAPFADAAAKIREIYEIAYPKEVAGLPPVATLRDHIDGVLDEHPEFSHVSSWRVAITATIQALNMALEGDALPAPKKHHDDIVSSLEDD
jgi:hypothetical protein